MRWFIKLKAFKPFTEQEAWTLFKLAAIGEAVGWTCLIIGVVIQHYKLPGYSAILPVVGQIHGTLFIFYLGIAISAFNSLGWSLKRGGVAVIASVPPYGTLVFEQWAARNRQRRLRQSYRRIVVRAIIDNGTGLLAVQPSDRASWHLPGGYIEASETAEVAVARIVSRLTGINPIIGPLRYVVELSAHHESILEFYFSVINVKDFATINLANARRNATEIDEIRYVKPRTIDTLEPAFLRTEPLAKITSKDSSPPTFLLEKSRSN